VINSSSLKNARAARERRGYYSAGTNSPKVREKLMEKRKKKKYEKPRLRGISLDARTVVLGFCKTQSANWGPGESECNFPACCSSCGS
jgi:hypothetical protein